MTSNTAFGLLKTELSHFTQYTRQTSDSMISHSNNHSLAEAEEIIAKGHSAATERLPELVAWLANQNSPGFSEIAEYLTLLGEVVVPHVKSALQEIDQSREWHSALLFTQVRHWPREWLAEIEEELNDLAWYGSERWEVDEDAAYLLAKNNLGNRDNLKKLIRRKKEMCHSRLKRLDEIEQYL
jgi:hypothetical protein